MILGDESPDIEWSSGALEGVPFLCLQASGPTMSAGMACFEVDPDIQFRVLHDLEGPPSFALFNGDPKKGARITLEAPYEELIEPVIEAAAAGDIWLLFVQYISQGVRLSRYWAIKGSVIEEQGPFERWIVVIR